MYEASHIFGKIAIRGGEIPPVFRDRAFDALGLSNLFHCATVQSGIAVWPALSLRDELHHAVRARIREGVDQTA